MKNKSLIIGIIIGIAISIFVGFGVYKFVANSNNIDKEKTEETAKEIKKDASKDLIYLADYTLEGYEEAHYYCDALEVGCSISDIMVPYINIDTEDAYMVNKELKELYYETAGYFKEELESSFENNDYYSFAYYCNYKYYINNNILSVVVCQEMKGGDALGKTYFTYNFDLNNGKKLSFEDIYKAVGFSKEEINEKVKKVIANCEIYVSMRDIGGYEEALVDEMISNSIKKYEDNTFGYFIANNGVLSISVELDVPAGGGIYNKILEVHKEDSKNNYSLYKIRENKNDEFVTYAKYDTSNMYETSYILNKGDGEEWHFAERVNAPYININSEDARKANKEIKEEYDKVANLFQKEVLSNEDYSNTAYSLSYYCFQYDYYLSIVVVEKEESIDLSYENSKYFTYNFDLTTGKLMTYEEFYKVMGYTEKEIDEKIINEIKEFPYVVCFDGDEQKQVLDKAIKNYKEALKEGKLKYSMNNNDEMSIYFKLETPGYYESSESEIEIWKKN